MSNEKREDEAWKKAWEDGESELVGEYDLIHDIYIPKRKEQLALFPRHARFVAENRTFIDLGAGTGAAAFAVLREHAGGRALLIDGSRPMLARAEQIARENGFDVEIRLQDLKDPDWRTKCGISGEHSLVISNLMIHHLTDPEKRRFFRDIHEILLPGGAFLYGDIVRLETDEDEDLHHDLWVEDVIRNRRAAGHKTVPFAEEKRRMIEEHDRQGDMPATVPFILEALRDAGFRKRALIRFHIKFAFFAAYS